MSFRTIPPADYLAPTRQECSEAAKMAGLGAFSHDLMQDIAKIVAGGQIALPSSYAKIVEDRHPVLEPDQYNDLSSRLRQSAKARKEEMEYHQRVCDFLQALKLEKVPGESPLETAANVLKLLSRQKGGEGEPLPIFQKAENDAAKKIEKMCDDVEQLSQEQRELLKDEGQDLSPMEEILKVKNERVMLEIARKLSLMTKLRVIKQKKFVEDPQSSETKTRPIASYSELNRLRPEAWAMYKAAPDLFYADLVQKKLPVRVRGNTEEKKQIIYILCDCSGSMRGERSQKAAGIVMNRLEAVLRGDAEVWVSLFDSSLKQRREAKDKEAAQATMAAFKKEWFSGGSTDIPAAVKAATEAVKEEMSKRKDLYRPEIVVISDEDCSSDKISAAMVEGFRVHGFVMGARNPGLKKIATQTGGVYEEW